MTKKTTSNFFSKKVLQNAVNVQKQSNDAYKKGARRCAIIRGQIERLDIGKYNHLLMLDFLVKNNLGVWLRPADVHGLNNEIGRGKPSQSEGVGQQIYVLNVKTDRSFFLEVRTAVKDSLPDGYNGFTLTREVNCPSKYGILNNRLVMLVIVDKHDNPLSYYLNTFEFFKRKGLIHKRVSRETFFYVRSGKIRNSFIPFFGGRIKSGLFVKKTPNAAKALIELTTELSNKNGHE